jgi:hypothetical protein
MVPSSAPSAGTTAASPSEPSWRVKKLSGILYLKKTVNWPERLRSRSRGVE